MTKHGAPDWSKYRIDAVTEPVLDLGELAVRLGSIVSYNRGGDVIVMESFEEGLIHVRTDFDGSSGGVAQDATTARTGLYSAKLTAGSSDDKNAVIYKDIMPTGALRIGIEASFASVGTDTIHDLYITYLDRSNQYYAAVRYDAATFAFQYYDENGAWQDIATGLHLYNNKFAYHTMKVVANFETHLYMHAHIDSVEHHFVSTPLRAVTTGLGPYFIAYTVFAHTGSGNPYTYVDDFIITQDEP